MMALPAGGSTSVPAVVTRMVLLSGEVLMRTEWLQFDGSWGRSGGAQIYGSVEEADGVAREHKADGFFVAAVISTRADHAAQERRRAERAEVALASVVEVETAAGRRDWHVGRPNCGVE